MFAAAVASLPIEQCLRLPCCQSSLSIFHSTAAKTCCSFCLLQVFPGPRLAAMQSTSTTGCVIQTDCHALEKSWPAVYRQWSRTNVVDFLSNNEQSSKTTGQLRSRQCRKPSICLTTSHTNSQYWR